MSSGDKVAALQFLLPSDKFQIALLNAEVDFVTKRAVRGPDLELDAHQLSSHLQSRFAGQVLTAHQELSFEYQVRALRAPVLRVKGQAHKRVVAWECEDAGAPGRRFAVVFRRRHAPPQSVPCAVRL